MDDLVTYLGESALFGGLESDAIERIARRFELRTYKEGDKIFCEGDEGHGMYVLCEGEVAVLKTMGLAEHELTRLSPGEHFGEMALISNAHRTATVQATMDSSCGRLDQKGFDELMDADARFAQRILKVLADRLHQTDIAAAEDMLKAHQALSFSLAKLADSRDPATGAHLYRVRDYSTYLAGLLKEHRRFKTVMTDSFIESIYLVAPLHDIGKVAIPDGILLKEGKLTEAEFHLMSSHTTLGAEALDTVLEYCDFEVFHMARRVILCHHERYDGKGYPRGLCGEEIPVEARIMTLADVYDALLSKRVYKPAFGYEEARDRIAESKGKIFDPDMAGVMLDHIDEFEKIHSKYVVEEDILI